MSAESSAAPTACKIAGVQLDVTLGDVAGNLARIEARTRTAAEDGAQLVVFPECALTGYCFESRDEGLDVAEEIPGPSCARVESLAKELGVYIAFGLLERDGDRLFNAAVLVGPNGLIGKYRKTHLPHLGVDHYVDPGDLGLPVHETPLGRIGLNICYDGSFPETARLMALQGADIILLPTNWPNGAEEFARYCINSRALENKVFYVAVNRVGKERGFRFIGTSRICDTHGRSLVETDEREETIFTAEIDPNDARTKRIDRAATHWIDRMADRRPDLYGPLASE
ncbi:MAG: carbon-nitrogen hydrolase family protein [Planctomycetota bacterium]